MIGNNVKLLCLGRCGTDVSISECDRCVDTRTVIHINMCLTRKQVFSGAKEPGNRSNVFVLMNYVQYFNIFHKEWKRSWEAFGIFIQILLGKQFSNTLHHT